jgi:hypothetical protein
MRRVVMVIFAAILAAPALATAADSPIKIVALPYIDHELAPVAVDGTLVTVAGTVEAAWPGAEVVIEARRCTRGAPFRTVGAVPPSSEGIFRAQVPAYAGTFFRARFGGAASATAVVRWPAPLRVTTGREYGALRIRTVATKDQPCAGYPGTGPEGYDPGVILDLDTWVLIPR